MKAPDYSRTYQPSPTFIRIVFHSIATPRYFAVKASMRREKSNINYIIYVIRCVNSSALMKLIHARVLLCDVISV